MPTAPGLRRRGLHRRTPASVLRRRLPRRADDLHLVPRTTDPAPCRTRPNPPAAASPTPGTPPTSFTIDVNLTDGQTHDVALYFLDWYSGGRNETVQVTDAATGAVLDTETVSSFSGGDYLQWAVSGDVEFTFTKTAGTNAVLTGLFFDPATSGANLVAVQTSVPLVSQSMHSASSLGVSAIDGPSSPGLAGDTGRLDDDARDGTAKGDIVGILPRGGVTMEPAGAGSRRPGRWGHGRRRCPVRAGCIRRAEDRRPRPVGKAAHIGVGVGSGSSAARISLSGTRRRALHPAGCTCSWMGPAPRASKQAGLPLVGTGTGRCRDST